VSRLLWRKAFSSRARAMTRRVLHGLWYLVDEVGEGRRKPDFTVLRAMMHYIDTFPEKLHHPKELGAREKR